jgi:hypothetical protein
MLFALPSYQFPYIVMNRCLYLIVFKGGKLSNVWRMSGVKGDDGVGLGFEMGGGT